MFQENSDILYVRELLKRFIQDLLSEKAQEGVIVDGWFKDETMKLATPIIHHNLNKCAAMTMQNNGLVKIRIICMEVDKNVAVKRMMNRGRAGKGYNEVYDGTLLVSDLDERTSHDRFAKFATRHEGQVRHLLSSGYCVRKIHANKDVHEVYRAVMDGIVDDSYANVQTVMN